MKSWFFDLNAPPSLPKPFKMKLCNTFSGLARVLRISKFVETQASSRLSDTRKSRDLSGVETQQPWINRQTFPSG